MSHQPVSSQSARPCVRNRIHIGVMSPGDQKCSHYDAGFVVLNVTELPSNAEHGKPLVEVVRDRIPVQQTADDEVVGNTNLLQKEKCILIWCLNATVSSFNVFLIVTLI